ncbi:MAG TPA: hypothetical protein VGW57_10115 [Chthoniobacterales bacterium]|nr:hypothetical protein [Chthoniobacterales bacterium]
MTELFRWANDNQGVISLFALAVTLPTLLILLVNGARKFWPSREQKRIRAEQEFAHASRIKQEVERRLQWEKIGLYGEILLRDVERKLPETEENHSSVVTPYSIVVLSDVHNEHLEFITGAMGIKHIKNIAGCWHFADHRDEDAIKVDTVCWLNYRDIAFIRWETNEYWEWPQICCKFTSRNKFPFSRVFFAEEKQGVARPFFSEVCLVSDVFPKLG